MAKGQELLSPPIPADGGQRSVCKEPKGCTLSGGVGCTQGKVGPHYLRLLESDENNDRIQVFVWGGGQKD